MFFGVLVLGRAWRVLARLVWGSACAGAVVSWVGDDGDGKRRYF